MICRNCGRAGRKGEHFCSQCGIPLVEQDLEKEAVPERKDGIRVRKQPWEAAKPADPEDDGGCIWVFLAYSMPLVGLILYFKWREDKPNRAESCRIGLLIWLVCMGVGIVLGVIVCLIVLCGVYL